MVHEGYHSITCIDRNHICWEQDSYQLRSWTGRHSAGQSSRRLWAWWRSSPGRWCWAGSPPWTASPAAWGPSWPWPPCWGWTGPGCGGCEPGRPPAPCAAGCGWRCSWCWGGVCCRCCWSAAVLSREGDKPQSWRWSTLQLQHRYGV